MSIFGWSYPPGAENDPNAPYNQTDAPCEVCGLFPDDCICPECPNCGEIGNPNCYTPKDPTSAVVFQTTLGTIVAPQPIYGGCGLTRSLGQVVMRSTCETQWEAEERDWVLPLALDEPRRALPSCSPP